MEWLQPLSNFGAIGVVLAFFLKVHYDVVTKFLPDLAGKVLAELREERERRERLASANAQSIEHLAQKIELFADAFMERERAKKNQRP